MCSAVKTLTAGRDLMDYPERLQIKKRNKQQDLTGLMFRVYILTDFLLSTKPEYLDW